MNKAQLREAKGKLSTLIDAAERGEPTTVTRHGKPAAMIVPMEQARAIYPEEKSKRSFAEWLLSIPGEIPIEPRRSPIRSMDFD